MKKLFKGKTLVLLLFIIGLIFSMTITAFAIGTTMTWLQGTNPNKTESLGTLNPGSGNNCGIKFAGVATTAESGSYRVKLQRKNIFGFWVDAHPNAYVFNSDSVSRYDSRLGTWVNGQPFLAVWNISGSAEYGIRFEVVSNPQVLGMTNIAVWTYNNG